MQIQVKEITPPRPANVEKGWEAGKTYKITDGNGIFYYANPQFVTNITEVKTLDNIDIRFKEKIVGGNPRNFVDSITIITADIVPAPQTQAPVTNYVEEGTAGGHDVSELAGTGWAIILQACVNRDATLSANEKLKFILMNYSRGSVGAFKHLQQTEDLDNTTLSDDPIPNF